MHYTNLALLATLGILLMTEYRLHRRNRQFLDSLCCQIQARQPFTYLARCFYLYPVLAIAESFFWRWEPGLQFSQIAIALLTLALALRIWSVLSLGQYWTMSCRFVETAPIIASGPYRLLRHPEYLARTIEVIAVCGIFMAPLTALVTLSLLLWLIPVVAAAEVRQLRELASGPVLTTEAPPQS